MKKVGAMKMEKKKWKRIGEELFSSLFGFGWTGIVVGLVAWFSHIINAGMEGVFSRNDKMAVYCIEACMLQVFFLVAGIAFVFGCDFGEALFRHAARLTEVFGKRWEGSEKKMILEKLVAFLFAAVGTGGMIWIAIREIPWSSIEYLLARDWVDFYFACLVYFGLALTDITFLGFLLGSFADVYDTVTSIFRWRHNRVAKKREKREAVTESYGKESQEK